MAEGQRGPHWPQDAALCIASGFVRCGTAQARTRDHVFVIDLVIFPVDIRSGLVATFNHGPVVDRNQREIEMQVTINVPDTFVVAIRGTDVTIDYTKAEALEEMAQRLWDYGHRKFNDASPNGMTAPGKDAPESEKLAFKKVCVENAQIHIANWLAGAFEVERGGGGRESDPIGKRAKLIATQMIEAKYGRLPKDATDADKAARAKAINEATAKDAFRAKAKAQLDEEAAMADLV